MAKFKFKIPGKKIDVEAEVDAEKLMEKAMDIHDKNWKEKFDTKYN